MIYKNAYNDEANWITFSFCVISSGSALFRGRRKGEHSPMAEEISLRVNGRELCVREGTSVAAAILMVGEPSRVSVQGEPRTPFCGMGICMECRATVNGIHQQQTCQMLCEAEMEVFSE
jgi:sarcosine oxidase subunit alpha